MKRYLFALLLVAAPFAVSLSVAADPNYYDQQEAIRRAVEHVQKRDREEREAAKQRADQKEREANRIPQTPERQLFQVIFLGVPLILGFGWLLYRFTRPLSHTPKPARVSEAQMRREDQEERERYLVAQLEREREAIAMAGAGLTEIINSAIQRGMTHTEIERSIWEGWRITFTLEGGRLNITKDQLLRASPHIPKMREVFNVAETVAEPLPRYWKLF